MMRAGKGSRVGEETRFLEPHRGGGHAEDGPIRYHDADDDTCGARGPVLLHRQIPAEQVGYVAARPVFRFF